MPAPTNPKKKSLMPSSPLRKTLRGAGHHLSVIVQVGKEGVTDAVLRQLSGALDHHELVKLKVGTESPEDRFEVADALAERADAQVAQVLGRTVLVYRRHPEHPRFESRPASRSLAWREGSSEDAAQPGPARAAPARAAPASAAAVKRAPAARAPRARASSGRGGAGARRGAGAGRGTGEGRGAGTGRGGGAGRGTGTGRGGGASRGPGSRPAGKRPAAPGAPAKRGASPWKRGASAGKRGPAPGKRGAGPAKRTSAGKPGSPGRRMTAKPRPARSPARKRS